MVNVDWSRVSSTSGGSGFTPSPVKKTSGSSVFTPGGGKGSGGGGGGAGTSPITRQIYGGAASFGGGSSPVGRYSSVIQQQAAAKSVAIQRAADLKNRTQQLIDRDSALGQSKLELSSQKKVLDALQARINEAAKRPLTTDTYYNKLVSQYQAKAKTFGNKSAFHNQLVGTRNAYARGLAEQFQVEEAKAAKEIHDWIRKELKI